MLAYQPVCCYGLKTVGVHNLEEFFKYGEIVTTWLICIAAMLDARQSQLLT